MALFCIINLDASSGDVSSVLFVLSEVKVFPLHRIMENHISSNSYCISSMLQVKVKSNGTNGMQMQLLHLEDFSPRWPRLHAPLTC